MTPSPPLPEFQRGLLLHPFGGYEDDSLLFFRDLSTSFSLAQDQLPESPVHNSSCCQPTRPEAAVNNSSCRQPTRPEAAVHNSSCRQPTCPETAVFNTKVGTCYFFLSPLPLVRYLEIVLPLRAGPLFSKIC